jgi:hypothetical protein
MPEKLKKAAKFDVELKQLLEWEKTLLESAENEHIKRSSGAIKPVLINEANIHIVGTHIDI